MPSPVTLMESIPIINEHLGGFITDVHDDLPETTFGVQVPIDRDLDRSRVQPPLAGRGDSLQ